MPPNSHRTSVKYKISCSRPGKCLYNPSCYLYSRRRTNGKDKEHDLEFKALRGAGMNTLGQPTLDETAGSFHDFTASCLHIGNIRRHRALGVFLANGLQKDTGLLHQVFHRIVSKGTVGIDHAASGQIKTEAG